MKTILAAALAAFSLSACETLNTWPTPEEMATFGPGDNAVVVLSATDNFGCGVMDLAFVDGKTKFEFNREVPTGGPAAAVVKPGKYRLYYARCYSAVGSLKGVVYWFDDVEVKPKEVVYLGTFNLDAISVATQAGVLENIFSLGLTAITGNASTYPVYAMLDQTEQVRAELRKTYPELANAMVTRIPEAVLSRDDFAQAFRNAYAKKPDGSMPTDAEAEAKLDGEIDKAIEASIARYAATHPDFAKEAQKKPASPAPSPGS